MSNYNEVLQQNNTDLQSNNTDLEGLLTAINALPDYTEPKPEQTKTATPSLSQQTIVPDSGYTLSSVTVNAMPTATQATPSISVSSDGLITTNVTQTAGYVSAGTKSATKQLTTQAAKTVTPTTSSQTAVASGRYTTGAVTVAAIPSSYIVPSGTMSITSNGTYDVKNYASVSVNIAGEDVTSETNTYTSLLDELESVIGASPAQASNAPATASYSNVMPAAMRSVGGSYKTCTLTPYTEWKARVCYTTIENGEIVYKNADISNTNAAITVLCDSIIYYAANEPGDQGSSFDVDGDFEMLYQASRCTYAVIKAPTIAGASGVLYET